MSPQVLERGAGSTASPARVTHQRSKHLPGFERGIVIRTAINNHASHHDDLARLKRVFDQVHCLIK